MPRALPSIRLCLDPVSFPGLSQATDLVSRGCDRSHVSFFPAIPRLLTLDQIWRRVAGTRRPHGEGRRRGLCRTGEASRAGGIL